MNGLTPTQMRARMVASYIESYRRAGVQMSTADVERQVTADCELVDAARRAGDIPAPGTKPVKRDPSPRGDTLEAAQRQTGTKLTKSAEGEPVYDRHVFMDANPQTVSERWGAACARIQRILQGAGKSSSVTKSVNDSEHPELVRQYMETYWYFTTRGQPAPKIGGDHNPFRGLADRDAARLFMRRVEDICDRSTGVLGGWYTGISATGSARR